MSLLAVLVTALVILVAVGVVTVVCRAICAAFSEDDT
jgi:hypothetical protein